MSDPGVYGKQSSGCRSLGSCPWPRLVHLHPQVHSCGREYPLCGISQTLLPIILQAPRTHLLLPLATYSLHFGHPSAPMALATASSTCGLLALAALRPRSPPLPRAPRLFRTSSHLYIHWYQSYLPLYGTSRRFGVYVHGFALCAGII